MMSEEAASIVKEITLGHMLLSVDIDKIFTEEYPERSHDFLLYSVQRFYLKYLALLQKENGKISSSLQKAALSYARKSTMISVFTQWDAIVKGAQTIAVNEAEQSGWYRDFEYDDIAELLSSFMDDEDISHTMVLNWKNAAEVVLPLAKRFDVPIEKFVSSTLQRKKFITALPAFNYVHMGLKTGMLDPVQAEAMFEQVISDCANQQISTREMQRRQQVMRGIAISAPPRVDALVYDMPYADKPLWIVIPATEQELSGIEQLLATRVKLSWGKTTMLFNQIMQAVILSELKVEDLEEDARKQLETDTLSTDNA